MTRKLAVAAVLYSFSLSLAGCEKSPEAETPDVPQTPDTGPAANARFEYGGRVYDLFVVGDCGPRSDGTYGTWAMTLDSAGEPLPDGPQILASSRGNWSVIDFHNGSDDNIVRVYREGRDKFGFENGVLRFSGELGAGLKERATAEIVCP